MHVRSKFDGGKQINHSQNGSWQRRCAGAALRMNEGPSWGPMCWKQVTGMQPSSTFESVAASRSKKVTKDWKRKTTSLQKKRLGGKNVKGATIHYSLDLTIHDMTVDQIL